MTNQLLIKSHHLSHNSGLQSLFCIYTCSSSSPLQRSHEFQVPLSSTIIASHHLNVYRMYSIHPKYLQRWSSQPFLTLVLPSSCPWCPSRPPCRWCWSAWSPGASCLPPPPPSILCRRCVDWTVSTRLLLRLESASAMEELRYLIKGDQFKIEF